MKLIAINGRQGSKTRFGLNLVLVLGLALAAAGCTYMPPKPPQADNVPATPEAAQWRAVSAETGKITDIDGLEALARDFPDSGSVRLRLLQAHFVADDRAGVIEQALWLARRGYSFSEGGRKQIVRLAGETAVADRLAALFERNAKPAENSKTVAVAPAEAKLAEAVLPYGDMFLVSTVVSRDLFVGEASSWKSLNLEGASSLAGLADDPARGVIWISSGVYDPTPDTGGAFSGLLGFRPEAQKIVYRSATPDGATPSDIHLADNGQLFASAPIAGGIYSAAPMDGELELLIPPGTFRSPQGLATSADGSKLYISDYRYGIAIVDLAANRIGRLTASKPMLLDGIDGMWRIENRLIGVQNGQIPMRIVEIILSPDGNSAADLRVLEQAHSEWTEPLGGNIHGGFLYYVATGQWDRFEQGGAVKQGTAAGPTQIRRLPLD